MCKPKSHCEVVKRPLAGGLLVINAARRDPAAAAEERELAAASTTAEGRPGRRRDEDLAMAIEVCPPLLALQAGINKVT
jgi:hypothetical protein